MVYSAKLKDMWQVLTISNEPTVRAVSIKNSKQITKKEHSKWYAKILKDNKIIFLLYKCFSKAVGQLRFKISKNNKHAEISISVLEAYRSKHIATKLIKKGIKLLKKRDIKYIVAKIKPENYASRELFLSLGFYFIGSESLCNIYEYKI